MIRPRKKKLGGLALERRLMLDASLPVLAGQVLWLDASDASTIIDADGDNAATGTGGNNDGFSGTVAIWADKSTSNFDVTSSGTQQPTYGATTLNGLSTISFDGINDRLVNTTASMPGSNYTTFIVFSRDSSGGREAVYDFGQDPSRNGMFINDGGINKYSYYVNGNFYFSTGNYTPGDYDLMAIRHAGTFAGIAVDGVSQIFTTTVSRTTTTGIYLGDDSTSGDWLDGQIAEMIVYNQTLNVDQTHDVENYLATKWGLTIPNVNPVIATNGGLTLDELTSASIVNLSSTDADNSNVNLTYTITDVTDQGHLYNSNTSTTLALSDTFTQGDINSGYIVYYSDVASATSDAFSFTMSDGYATPVAGTFSITITPVNNAPVIDGWTQVSIEDFEGGATGWSDNTTTNGGAILTNYLGRHSMEAAAQNTYKTYALSGTQDYTTISFDFYRIDSWDSESFIIYVDDVAVFSNAFTTGYTSPSDGASGAVSWTIQETTPFSYNFAHSGWNDQTFHVVLTVQSTAASLKLGFSSTLNQAVADEAWGVDNIIISEVASGGTPGNFQVSEKSTNGEVIGTITATDPDVADTLSYSITGGTGAGIFSINSTTGKITVANASVLDYETTPSYTLDILVSDNGTPVKTASTTVTIDVLDVPENTAPTVTGFGPVSVDENLSIGTVLGTVTSTDPQSDTVTYSITAGNTGGMFSINSTTGVITLAGSPDFESISSYTLTVTGTDNGFGNLSDSEIITININDVNEVPVIDGWTQVSIEDFESGATGWTDNTTTNGGSILTNYLGQHSMDAGLENTYKTYALSGTQDYTTISFDFYRIDSWDAEDFIVYVNGSPIALGTFTGPSYDSPSDGSSGAVSWTIQETTPFITNFVHNGSYADQTFHVVLTIQSTAASVKLGFSSTLNQAVTDEAWGVDNIIISEVKAGGTPGNFQVSEKSSNGDVVGTITATDPDAATVLTYSITGGTGVGVFTIDPTTGIITVSNASALDYETISSYTLDVQVNDNGTPSLSDSTTITIDVLDIPENTAPNVTGFGTVSVDENSSIGTVVGTVTSTDLESNTVTYSITGGNTNNMFSINSSTGVVTLAKIPDYEILNSYTLSIRGIDNGFGALTNTINVTININDVNEAPTLDQVNIVLMSDPSLRYDPSTGNFYKLSTSNTNYAGAKAAANSTTLFGVTGHLVNISSAAENAFVTSMISASTYIGASDAAVEGEWRWDDGPENGDLFWLGTGATGSAQNGLYTNWNGTEPNNSGNEDAIQLFTNGRWNDIPASTNMPYLIEWEGVDVFANVPNGNFSINENSPLNQSAGFVIGSDVDAGDVLTYSITGGTGAGVFALNSSTGEITLINVAANNYELNSSFTLDVEVVDSGGLTDTKTITINVNDMNDTPTHIDITNDHVEENAPLTTIVGSFSTIDEDPANTHIYSIVTNPGNKFSIIGTDLVLTDAIDYEAVQKIDLVIRTDDGNGGTYDQTVRIYIGDVMDTFVGNASDPHFDASPSHNGNESAVVREVTRSIIKDTVEGGEIGQQGAFYGLEKAFQIIREQMTFRVREQNQDHYRERPQAEDVKSVAGLNELVGQPQESDSDHVTFNSHYTNIRTMLEKLQNFSNTADGDPQETTVSQENGLERQREENSLSHILDSSFVDVMTYHEQKQERLRKALLNTG